MQKGIQLPLDNFECSRIGIVNKTGAATVPGGVYALDLYRASAATNTPEKAMRHIVAVSANNIDGILVVTEKAIAVDESGEGVLFGPVRILVKGDVTAIVAADRLAAVAGQAYLQKTNEAAGSTDIAVGKALESHNAAPALRQVYFMGLNLNLTLNPATT